MAIKGNQLSGSYWEKWANVAVTHPERQGDHHAYNLQEMHPDTLALVSARISTELLHDVVVLLSTFLRHDCGFL